MRSGVDAAPIACCVVTALFTAVACFIFGGDTSCSSDRFSGEWIAITLPQPLRGISRGPALLSALPPGETHAPYRSQPPSFLSSSRYKQICQGKQPCSALAYDASRLAAQQCTPATLSSWNGAGSWYRGSDGHYLYEPEHCTLRRFTAQQARQCLKHKLLAFVGDSITRYQYLSLNSFLSQGVWPERYGGNPEFNRSVCIETEFDGDWPEFYRHTSAVLSDARAAKSFESCNCRREDLTEQRVFNLHSFAVPGGNMGRLTVDFKFLGSEYKNTKALKAAIQGFAMQPPLYSSGAVVYNVGLWVPGGDFSSFFNESMSEVSAQLPSLLPPDAPRLRLLWKSITSNSQPEREAMYVKSDAEARRLLTPPWELMDARALTAQANAQHLDFTWDPVHYIPIVYEELNNVLLNMLCDADAHFVEQVPG